MKREPLAVHRPASTVRADAQAAFFSLASPIVDEAIGCAAEIEGVPSPESLHRLRVSLRKLRSLWWAYGPLLGKSMSSRQRAIYGQLASVAGRTRDWDIFIGMLTARKATNRRFLEGAATARAQASTLSRQALSNADVKTLLHDALATATETLNASEDRVPLRAFAEARISASEKDLRRRMKRAARGKRSGYAPFHDVRKAAKRLRYLLELFDPVLQGGHSATLKRLVKIQNRLGALNDAVASEDLFRRNASLLVAAGADESTLEWMKRERRRRMHAVARLLR